jgi:hypothetical protein
MERRLKVTGEYLSAYRLANRFVAAHRDESLCPLCESNASESDHVFGRGSVHDILKEHWVLRMSLCWKCHYQKHHGSGFNLVEQVHILSEINDYFIGSNQYKSTMNAISEGFSDEMMGSMQTGLDFIETWLAKNG